MKRTMYLTVAAVALGACTLQAADAAAGKALFAQKCKPCHGAEGQGNPAIAKSMKVTLAALGSKEVQAKSDADIKKVITAGKGKMKAATGVSEAQAADIVAFLRALK